MWVTQGRKDSCDLTHISFVDKAVLYLYHALKALELKGWTWLGGTAMGWDKPWFGTLRGVAAGGN